MLMPPSKVCMGPFGMKASPQGAVLKLRYQENYPFISDF